MITCPACGCELADAAAFCSRCGTRLAAPPPLAEERKVVTTLFCDLVAFTAMSEAADPEDVDRLLGEYFARAAKAIESHGGTVEKFIGDAVVGVFGVPVVHEDDPERAVRAALRLVEALEDLTRPDGSRLRVRVGVNTGEALVRLDVDRTSGRGFLRGDAVNTAARLEAAAPPDAVVVGALTHDLTERVIAYEELPAIAAKGKADPVRAWLARVPVARTGVELGSADLTPLVDREVELGFLEALLEKAVAAGTPQFALLLGEAGIGKSRLVHELFAYVDARPGLTTWRQGRCLPYGEEVAFWALAEIVKAQAGIRETDARQDVEAKLEAVLPEGEDREWFRQRLGALLGLEAPAAAREENFTAWLRFLEELAAARPTVLVFEDLHWADEALLSFLEHLATHAAAVPLLVVATARPELLEEHPTFAAGSTHVNRISVDPLPPPETQRLVAGLLGAEALSEQVAELAAGCEGNPFFAEQSARLLTDLVAGAPAPASVQAVLAARLDALPPLQKAVLGDAAVVGSVFWDGAVADLGRRDRAEVEAALRDLVAKQLVRRVRGSAMAGEHEYSFAHALAREVAYQQLPRALRARRHADLAAWLEGKAGDRAGDLADILAHHYGTALELARAGGDQDLADSLSTPAVRALSLAGDRAVNLDVAAAERDYARALKLVHEEDPERARLLVRWAEALAQQNRYRDAVAALREAIPRLREGGDVRAAAIAMVHLARLLLNLGEPAGDLEAEAVTLLEHDGPAPELAEVLSYYGHRLGFGGARPQEVIAVADRALAVCERLGLPPSPRALGVRGMTRLDLGDPGGLDDVQRALASAKAQGLGRDQGLWLANLMTATFFTSGPAAALDIHREGLEFSRRRGIEEFVLSYGSLLVEVLNNLGHWDAALREAAEVIPDLERTEHAFDLLRTRSHEAVLLSRTGRASEAQPWLSWLVEAGRAESEVVWLRTYALLAASEARMAMGEWEAALALLREWASLPRTFGEPAYLQFLPEAVRTALRCGERDLAERLAASFEPTLPVGQHVRTVVQAALAEAHDDREAAAAGFADAVARWHDFGIPYEEAQALLGQGRCLLALGRAPGATAPLAAAREIFARLGAKPALAETDRLLDGLATGS